jgi:hypothetical protein
MIRAEKALDRVESRMKQIRVLKPANGWEAGSGLLAELKLLKAERIKLLDKLGFPA